MKLQIKGLLITMTFIATTLSSQAAYFGASAGYLVDNEDEIFSVQVGMVLADSANLSHNGELEIAYMNSSLEVNESINGMNVSAGVDIDVSPLLVNYLLRSSPENALGFYAGAGIGYSFYDISAWATDGSLSYEFEDSGEAFTWQLLAGLEYAFSSKASLRLGYRYVYLDDVSVSIEGEEISDSIDDSVIAVGIMLKF